MSRLTQAEFVATYRDLRARHWRRDRIRQHLGISDNALSKRYRRAVAAGLLTPDTERYRSGGRRTRCACCKHIRRIQSRDICNNCWARHKAAGTLDEHPRRTRTGADFAEDYAMLRARNLTRRDIADRLDMTPAAVQKAYSRAVKRGVLDPDPPAYRAHVLAVTHPIQHTHRWRPAA